MLRRTVPTTTIGNNEGDSPFWDDSNCEMNYDIDVNYFENLQHKILDLLIKEKNKPDHLENVNYHYGVERNG